MVKVGQVYKLTNSEFDYHYNAYEKNDIKNTFSKLILVQPMVENILIYDSAILIVNVLNTLFLSFKLISSLYL